MRWNVSSGVRRRRPGATRLDVRDVDDDMTVSALGCVSAELKEW
jgi:hypothetical protein